MSLPTMVSFRCAKGCDGDGHGGNGNTATDWTATVTFPTPARSPTTARITVRRAASAWPARITVNEVVTPPPPFTIRSGLSGNWDNPTAGQDGHGFQFEILPGNGMLAIWFVFTPDGTGQTWLYSQGAYDPTSDTVTLPALPVARREVPAELCSHRRSRHPWGTLTFTFTDCNNGTATWTTTTAGYPPSGTLPIQRLTTIAGTTCP